MLMNKCRIYDEDNRDRSAHYKSLSEKKEKSHYHGKNCIVLHVTKGSRRVQMRKSQVRERLSLLSSALSMVSWVIVPMTIRIMRIDASSMERLDILLLIVRVIV